MARIVYTWELGEDYGHIASFMPLAFRLRERGHEVIFVVQDLYKAESVVGRFGFHMLQAPRWPQIAVNLPGLPHSFADILKRHGFFDKLGLLGMVRSYCTLFSLLRPALLIADYSPTVLLTARGLGLKRAVFGTGFCAPPRVSPLPNMRHWNEVEQESLADSESHVLSVANSVLAEMNAQPLGMVAELFDADENFLCTLPEIDHYADRGEVTYWGPVFNIRQGVETDWPGGEGKRIFAYLKPQCADYDKIMAYLLASGQRVLVFSPGVSDARCSQYRSASMLLTNQPVNISRIIGDCDLAVCHAGHGTLGAFLLAGVPLLLLPLQLEQAMAAMRAVDLGVATMVNPDLPPEDYAPIFEALLYNPLPMQNARAFAARYADSFSQDRQIGSMIARIEQILAGTP